MKPVVYLCIQAELADFALRLRHMPLDEFIAAAETADTVGPVLHPTLYRVAGERLADVMAMARAAKGFCKVCEKMPEAWLAGIAHSLDDPPPAAEEPTSP